MTSSGGTRTEAGDDRALARIRYAYFSLLPMGAILAVLLAFVLPHFAPMPDPAALRRVFLKGALSDCRPEPLETLRYLFTIAFVPAFFLAWERLRIPLGEKSLAWGAVISQWLLFSFLAANFLYQDPYVHWYDRYLQIPEGALVMALGLVLMRSGGWRRIPPRWIRESKALPLLVAGLLTASYGLVAVFTGANLDFALDFYSWHLPFSLDEFAAVLNGRTLLVDFFPLYQHLTPYLLAPVFKIFGLTIASYTIATVSLGVAAFLLVFFVFARLARGYWRGLLLYVPFIGVSSFAYLSVGEKVINVFDGVASARYLAPWGMAFLLSSCVERARRGWLILFSFMVGALLAIHNLEFGIPAVAGAAVAILAVAERRSRAAALMSAGLLVGFSLFCGLTALRSGSLPDFSSYLTERKLIMTYGYTFLPAPLVGLHWVVVSSFLIALLTGWMMARSTDFGGGRLLPALLIYSGILGCGCMTYYMGRSHVLVLIALFPAWAFAFILLLWAQMHVMRKVPGRIHALPLIFLLLVSVCFAGVGFRPPPALSQIPRFAESSPAFEARQRSLVEFVRAHARPGERVGIVYPYGHLLALRAGVDNVFPYTEAVTLFLKRQLSVAMEQLARDGVTTVFGRVPEEMAQELGQGGFLEAGRLGDFRLWTKQPVTRRSRPRASRSGLPAPH